MFRFAALALFVATSAPAFAASEPKHAVFTRDGIEFAVTTVKDGDQLIVEGHEVESGKEFRLVARRGRVTGHYDGKAMSFRDPRSRAKILASR